ncbi:MAG: hypothetical protein ACLVJO_11310 [[Clostridium] scindens]
MESLRIVMDDLRRLTATSSRWCLPSWRRNWPRLIHLLVEEGYRRKASLYLHHGGKLCVECRQILNVPEFIRLTRQPLRKAMSHMTAYGHPKGAGGRGR